MAGIYIHIPFCHQKCSYCDFHFSTLLKYKAEVVDAICKELEYRKREVASHTLETIYLGGGTPSVLTSDELVKIFQYISNNYDNQLVSEITIEVNPEDVSLEFIKAIKQTPINRISLGVQSFVSEELTVMNRKHSSQQAFKAIKLLQENGYTNITADLIYGINANYRQNLQYNLSQLEALSIPHFSAYALTIEEKTLLHNQLINGKYVPPVDEAYEECFLMIHEFAKKNNYRHYEISNFAKQGYQAKHNTGYWNNKPYIGIGPSAHSFNGEGVRRWNIANNHIYVKKINKQEKYFSTETLTIENRWNEYLMTKLRTEKGLSLSEMNTCFNSEWVNVMLQKIQTLPQKWFLTNSSSAAIRLSIQGWLVSDYIVGQLAR